MPVPASFKFPAALLALLSLSLTLPPLPVALSQALTPSRLGVTSGRTLLRNAQHKLHSFHSNLPVAGQVRHSRGRGRVPSRSRPAFTGSPSVPDLPNDYSYDLFYYGGNVFTDEIKLNLLFHGSKWWWRRQSVGVHLGVESPVKLMNYLEDMFKAMSSDARGVFQGTLPDYWAAVSRSYNGSSGPVATKVSLPERPSATRVSR